MSLKKNVLANYLGQGWSALMGLAFIPVYIQYLGMEAFGLIGLFAVMQAWLTLLDMGMTPTLNREMARLTAGAHSPQSIRDLLRSLEVICYGLAVLIAIGVWASSDYLANSWLKAEQLPIEVITQALSIMALVVALRFCEGIYRGSLFGLQRQVWYNGANAIFATIRHGGVVGVLAWGSATLEAFFIWQVFASLLTVTVLAAKLHHTLPKAPLPAKFSRAALTGVWKFASGMMGITFLALLLTQVDKVLLSHLLSLVNFGYYTLAATVAGACYIVINPIVQAIYPRMVELVTQDDEPALISVYHQGAQLATVMTAPAVLLLSFFSAGAVFVWSGNADLAQNTAPILSILVLGTFLNSLMYIPYHLQLANGWTSLTLKTNIVAVAILVPAIFWLVPLYGAIGAAWIWLMLNVGYILIAIQFMHFKIIPKEKWRWYGADVLFPIGSSTAVLLLARVFEPTNYESRLEWVIFLMVTGVAAMVAAALSANRVRPYLKSFLLRTA